MNTWNLKLYCLHRELCQIAFDDIVNDRIEGWGTYRAAILVEAVADQKLAKLLKRKRLELVHTNSTSQAHKHLVEDVMAGLDLDLVEDRYAGTSIWEDVELVAA